VYIVFSNVLFPHWFRCVFFPLFLILSFFTDLGVSFCFSIKRPLSPLTLFAFYLFSFGVLFLYLLWRAFSFVYIFFPHWISRTLYLSYDVLFPHRLWCVVFPYIMMFSFSSCFGIPVSFLMMFSFLTDFLVVLFFFGVFYLP
jgi:hypothetical protein